MSQRVAFDRILASLHEAMLDDAHWLATSALIDEACGIKGNFLLYGYEHSPDHVQLLFARLSYRGQRNEELERKYFDVYYPWDESVPRGRRLPDSQVVPVRDLYTEQEKKTSPTYNEIMASADYKNSLIVRLDGPNGSRIVWSVADRIDGSDWSSSQLDMMKRLLPHLRQFVGVRQALVDAGAVGTSLTGLLDNRRSGVIQLDRRGRIVAANDLAHELLRRGDGLSDRGGSLRAWAPADDARLQTVLARALPRFGGQGASGSIIVGRPSDLPRLVVHVSPVDDRESDFRPWRVAALVLVVDPASRTCIDPALVEDTLDLSPAETHVAMLLAEGRTVREIAAATGRRESTIRWHLHHIFDKHRISRQVELVQLVLSLGGIP